MFTWLRNAGRATFLLLKLAALVRCCTVYEFNGSGFAANAFAIAHMVPIFHNTNGTFFLDNTNNHYKCSEEGGWHDFFAWEDQVCPSLTQFSQHATSVTQQLNHHSGLTLQLFYLIQNEIALLCAGHDTLL